MNEDKTLGSIIALKSLLAVVRRDWTGYGTELYALKEVGRLEEELKNFDGSMQ